MGLKYLLDTNVLSELSKQSPNKNIIKRVNESGNQSATASLVMHELNYGRLVLPNGKRKDNLTLFLKQLENYKFPVLPYDAQSAQIHALKRAELTSLGLTPAFVDGQIASIAIAHDLTLVSRNTKDFEHFNNLSLENWFE